MKIIYKYLDKRYEGDKSINCISSTLNRIIDENNLYGFDETEFYPHPNQNEAYFILHKGDDRHVIHISTEPKEALDDVVSFILTHLREIHEKLLAEKPSLENFPR